MKAFLILLLSGCCSLAGIQTGPAGSGSQTNGVTAAQVTNIVLGVNVASQVVTNSPGAGITTSQGINANGIYLTNSAGSILLSRSGIVLISGQFSTDGGQIGSDGSGDLFGNIFTGNGSGLTNLNAANFSSGNTSTSNNWVGQFTGNGSGITNITPSNLTGLVTLVNTTNWISFPSIGWTNNTTSTYYLAYLTAGSALTFKDGSGNGIWAITTSLPFVVGPGNKITGTGITGSLQQMPF